MCERGNLTCSFGATNQKLAPHTQLSLASLSGEVKENLVSQGLYPGNGVAFPFPITRTISYCGGPDEPPKLGFMITIDSKGRARTRGAAASNENRDAGNAACVSPH